MNASIRIHYSGGANQGAESWPDRIDGGETGMNTFANDKNAPDSVVRPPEPGCDVATQSVAAHRIEPESLAEKGGSPSSIRRTLPTLAVLLGLMAVGYWGHSSDWKIPKFSELSGTTMSAGDDWCAEHGVPESICIACKAELMPKGPLHGWCKVHGIAECVLEHPD